MHPRIQKYSDDFFKAAMLAMRAGDLHAALMYFRNAASMIIEMIPEDEQTPSDHLRIMNSYQSAIRCLTECCDGKLSKYDMDALKNKSDPVLRQDIIMLIEKLESWKDKATQHLVCTVQRSGNDEYSYYLSALKGLLEYHANVAEWYAAKGLYRQQHSELDHVTAVAFANVQARHFIDAYIVPKCGEFHASEDWRDLASCYHSIAKINRYHQAMPDCLHAAMRALDAIYQIPDCDKSENDIDEITKIYVTLSFTITGRAPLLTRIETLAYHLFIGADGANAENLQNVYRDVCANGSAIERAFMLLTMRIIYDNFPRSQYDSDLQRNLFDKSFNIEFKTKMDQLAARVNGNNQWYAQSFFMRHPDGTEAQISTPMKRFG